MKPSDVRRGAKLLLETELRRAAVAHFLFFEDAPSPAVHPVAKLDYAKALRVPRTQWHRWIAAYRSAAANGGDVSDCLRPTAGETWISVETG